MNLSDKIEMVQDVIHECFDTFHIRTMCRNANVPEENIDEIEEAINKIGIACIKHIDVMKMFMG